MCCFSVSQPADTFIHSATAVLCSDANVSCSRTHHLFYHIYGILICHAHISTNIRLRRIYSRHYGVSHTLNFLHMGAAVMANYEKSHNALQQLGFLSHLTHLICSTTGGCLVTCLIQRLVQWIGLPLCLK